jgi:xanthine dehydrogenase YagT iron-sulfur-binding subunit
MRPVAPTRRTILGPVAGMGILPRTSPAPAGAAAAPVSPSAGTILMVNGEPMALSLDPRVTLLDALREQSSLTGTKKGCDHGSCGACTVHIDGQRVLACLTLAMRCEGKAIRTIEGLADGDTLHPVQAAFLEHDGLQCGYCTPGQIMSAVALIDEGHAGTDDEIREWMSGNICRCGAYPNIVAAVRDAAANRKN